jgi:hypothetical protein
MSIRAHVSLESRDDRRRRGARASHVSAARPAPARAEDQAADIVMVEGSNAPVKLQ